MTSFLVSFGVMIRVGVRVLVSFFFISVKSGESHVTARRRRVK